MFGAAVSPTGPGPGLFTATAKDSSKLSPLLKGGRVLSEKVHRLMGDYKLEEFGLVRLSAVKHNKTQASSKSPDVAPSSVLIQACSQQVNGFHKVERPLKLSLPLESPEIKNFLGDEEIGKIRSMLQTHEHKLETMQQRLGKLEQTSTHTNKTVAGLQKKVQFHEQAFTTTMLNTQRALQQHQDMILHQHHMATSILRQRDGSDVLFETGFLVLSVYIVQTPVVQYTIHLLSGYWWLKLRQTSTARRIMWRIPQMLQVMFVFNIYCILKYVNHRLGISAGFWSSAKRVVRSLRNVGLSLGNLLWLPVPRQPAVPSRADVVQREYEKQIAQLTDRQRVRPQTLAYDRYLSQSEGNTNGIVRHKLESTISE